VVHTTSRPRRRSSGNKGKLQTKPLNHFDLKITAHAPEGWPERSASLEGIAVEEKGENVSFSVSADTPEEMIDKLKLIERIFSSKP
jgi:hypothetical protein